MALRLVVGLGNPGSEYQSTRHNVGFDALQLWAVEKGFDFRFDQLGPVEVARHDGLVLIKPLTFMNRSGLAVRQWVSWLKVAIEEVVVVVDDVALPLGEIRLRKGGSCGGHNGLRSVEESLGTQEYPRLRCGIGPLPENWALDRFVLSRFEKEAQTEWKKMLGKTVETLQYCQRDGIEVAMNRCNGSMSLESEKEK